MDTSESWITVTDLYNKFEASYIQYLNTGIGGLVLNLSHSCPLGNSCQNKQYLMFYLQPIITPDSVSFVMTIIIFFL